MITFEQSLVQAYITAIGMNAQKDIIMAINISLDFMIAINVQAYVLNVKIACLIIAHIARRTNFSLIQ